MREVGREKERERERERERGEGERERQRGREREKERVCVHERKSETHLNQILQCTATCSHERAANLFIQVDKWKSEMPRTVDFVRYLHEPC